VSAQCSGYARIALENLKQTVMNKLSDAQIKQKLQQGRNYNRLYTELKVKYDDAQAKMARSKVMLW
jgi:hypothetical protein